MESRRAEQIDPFMFGYEYQYILLMFSITLFYTVVTPVILPVGLVFMCLKHFVDKYNLIYIYPKAPESDNQLTQRVIGLIFFVLIIYQVIMTGFLVLYKEAILPGMFVVAIAVGTAACGVYILAFYFSEIKKERKVLGKGNVNLESFKNCYNNPCKILERQLYSRKNISKLLSNNFVRTPSQDLAQDQVIEVQDSWSEVSPPFYPPQEFEEEYVTDVVEIDSDPNPPVSYSPEDLSIVEIDADLPSHPHPLHDESPSIPVQSDLEEVYEEIDLDSA